jgi:hypothetical protein
MPVAIASLAYGTLGVRGKTALLFPCMPRMRPADPSINETLSM